MNVPERIHIIPLGYERDRIVEPPRRLNADKIVLMNHDGDDEAPNYHDEARQKLREAGIDIDERECDIFDLYTCLGAIAKVITELEGDAVYVNLATGSKVTAIAGMIACMATGATPYYVSAERYGPEEQDLPENPVSFGVADIEELSGYPIDSPSEQAIRVLSYLDREGMASKGDIIEFSEREGLPFITESETTSQQGKHQRLRTHVMNDLIDDGYVSLDERG